MSTKVECIKLTATYTNNVAVAFIAIGFLAPAIGGRMDWLMNPACFLISFGLHVLARRMLKGLDNV